MTTPSSSIRKTGSSMPEIRLRARIISTGCVGVIAPSLTLSGLHHQLTKRNAVAVLGNRGRDHGLHHRDGGARRPRRRWLAWSAPTGSACGRLRAVTVLMAVLQAA